MTGSIVGCNVLHMDSNQAPLPADRFRDEAILLAWQQCLRENGLTGAMGCAHIAVDAADELVAQRGNNGKQS